MLGEDHDLERLRRALVPVVAVVLLTGLVAAAIAGSEQRSAATDRAEASTQQEESPADGGDSSSAVSADDGGDEGAGTGDDAGTTSVVVADAGEPEGLGLTGVPVPGAYVYQVVTTGAGGGETTRTELREISVLSGEGASATLRVVARSEEEEQVSVLEWSPAGVAVRSSRFIPVDGAAYECSWEPPLVDFGALAAGETWSIDSTCRAEVAGLPTTIRITGDGRVVSETEVRHAGASVPVWEVARNRTTIITTTVGNETLEQRLDEQTTVFIDPARGLVLRSEAVVTQSGPQQGRSERVATLQEG